MVWTGLPRASPWRRGAGARAGRAASRSQPTKARPAMAPAVPARNPLRVVMDPSVVTTLCTTRVPRRSPTTRGSLSHANAVRDLPGEAAHEGARVRHEAGDQELAGPRPHRALDPGHAVRPRARAPQAVHPEVGPVPAV